MSKYKGTSSVTVIAGMVTLLYVIMAIALFQMLNVVHAATAATHAIETLRLERSNQQFLACRYNKTFVTIFEGWEREINSVDRAAVLKHTIPLFYYSGHRKAGINLEYRLHRLVPVDCKVPSQEVKSLSR